MLLREPVMAQSSTTPNACEHATTHRRKLWWIFAASVSGVLDLRPTNWLAWSTFRTNRLLHTVAEAAWRAPFKRGLVPRSRAPTCASYRCECATFRGRPYLKRAHARKKRRKR